MNGTASATEAPWTDPGAHPTLSIAVAGRALGLGRSTAYRAAAANHIPTIRVGRTIRVPTVALRRMLGLEA